MTSKTSGKPATRGGGPAGKQGSREVNRLRGRRSGNRGWIIAWALLAVIAVGGLYLVYATSTGGHDAGTASAASGYRHVSGEPGAGDVAPPFTLPSSTGGQISLSDYRGQSVLLYFHGGLMCQPCLDQITDLEQNQAALREAGIDKVLSISHDPIDLLAQKAADMGLSTPLLSDPNLAVSRTYTTTQYGMMGGSANGHSFILVGPDGTITWRADYGGAPDYTMYLPTEGMLADLAAERTR
ncbi:MAG: redoxin domain-containing protein [Pseudonocardiaceae bacterium]|nr:redoxin domain-containing protein [Pseudonocardiaceae bacterium]